MKNKELALEFLKMFRDGESVDYLEDDKNDQLIKLIESLEKEVSEN